GCHMVHDEAHRVGPLQLVVDRLPADVAVGFGGSNAGAVAVALGGVAWGLAHALLPFGFVPRVAAGCGCPGACVFAAASVAGEGDHHMYPRSVSALRMMVSSFSMTGVHTMGWAGSVQRTPSPVM